MSHGTTTPTRSGLRGGYRHAKKPVTLAGGGIDVRFDVADNPYHNRAHKADNTNPKHIQVARNINESPLVRLSYLGRIDEVQSRAGFKFRALYERVMIRIPSPSLIKERVDNSGAPDVYTQNRSDASRILASATSQLTELQLGVLHFVVGEGGTLEQMRDKLCRRRGYELVLLREALDRLVDIWGMKPANQNGRA